MLRPRVESITRQISDSTYQLGMQHLRPFPHSTMTDKQETRKAIGQRIISRQVLVWTRVALYFLIILKNPAVNLWEHVEIVWTPWTLQE